MYLKLLLIVTILFSMVGCAVECHDDHCHNYFHRHHYRSK